MTDCYAVLEAEPGKSVWLEICRLAEGMPDAGVAEVADRLRAWPARSRPMPDRWWAQWQAGDHRPWHALATHRRLCQLGKYFYVSVAACPHDLGLLLAGSGATSNSDQGEVLLLSLTPEIETVTSGRDAASNLVPSLAQQATAVEALFSPDGSQVIVSFS
ncbi:hypothetical protein [Actinomadura rudentiformis]|uniref:Uncharacterized protein n=1 Tax=Actinomadura rudentiformis TaxID=359158 RepID=A0A6H9YMM5_9ACTN|nr:hypothetical protein [Actinomadura rudentiformis]KAB2348012.1 hypothetical protein F8566_19270 [Actinomadura rudentiformis]